MFAVPLQNVSLGSKTFRAQDCKNTIVSRRVALKANKDDSSVIDALDGLLGTTDEVSKPNYSSDDIDSKAVPVE